MANYIFIHKANDGCLAYSLLEGFFAGYVEFEMFLSTLLGPVEGLSLGGQTIE